ncbi:MAG: LemA family protein [Eubacteriales bacterium]|jgi:LemA protein
MKLKTSTIVLIVLAAVILLLAILSIGSYNGLVDRYEKVEKYKSEIDNQLQRRSDLIPNLVSTVKQYANHESKVFTDIAEARAKLAGANTVAESAEADAQLRTALTNLLAIAEAYPELKANQNFINLQDELAGTENRIANARRDYNNAAKDYNTKVRKFPSNIFANMFGFDTVEYFQASEGSKDNPDVGDLFGD